MRNGSELSPCSESGVREARIPGKRGLRAEQAADGDRQLFAMSFVFSLDLIGVKRPTGRHSVYQCGKAVHSRNHPRGTMLLWNLQAASH